MMMSKPAPKQEEETPKSKNILTPPAPLGGSTKPASSTDAVADLERRLAQLSGPTVAAATTTTTLSSQTPETTATTTAARAPVKGGKNALLVSQKLIILSRLWEKRKMLSLHFAHELVRVDLIVFLNNFVANFLPLFG